MKYIGTLRIGQRTICAVRRMQPCIVLVVLVLVSAISSVAFGQLTTADILGTATDASGAVIPNAAVTLTNLDTQQQRTDTTNASGDFSFTLLPTGHYSVTVKAAGFKISTTENLAGEAGDRARADAHMEAGSEAQTIEVQAQTPLLQADNATVSSTVTAKAVQDLPLNGRNFVQLVQLVPGANEGPGNGLTSGGRPDDRRSTSGFSVNGQDDTLNNYVIDGIDDNERIIGTIGVKPNVEGIQEITVQTNSYSAEAGRTAGGVVNIVTKTGTNSLHGSVYEYFRNDIFDARNVLSNPPTPKSELRQNQFGASIGGPIIKDRTFFFGDYEGLRQVSGTTYSSTVPTLAQYNEINSIVGSPADVVAAGHGTAGYPIDPIALNYLKLFPAPNAPGISNNYIVNPNKTQSSNLFDVRVDHKFNANNLFFARYSYNKVNTVTPQALGITDGIAVSGGRYIFAGPAADAGQQYAFNYTHIFNSNLLVDLKAAFTRINNLSLPLNNGTNPDTKVGFSSNMNFNSLSSFLTPVGIGSFSDIGDGAYVPLQDIDNTFQYLGTVSWNLGNHDVKIGASLIRRQARNVQSAFAAGQYSFGLSSDASSGDAATTQLNNIASTLVGAFTSASRNYDLDPPDYRTWEPSGFVQDSWKVNPNLTVVYGVRYDVFTPFTEAHNHISNFDYYQALNSTGTTVGSALKVAGVNGVSSTAGIQTVYSDVAPRVGFSATVMPGTVVRGGYGLSFFPGNYTSNADLKNAPFTSVYSPTCESTVAYQIQSSLGQPNITPDCATIAGAATTFDEGLPLPAPQSITSNSLSFVAENPHLKPALIQQFNLQVERQFGSNVVTVGYVGNIGQHLPETINDINVPVPNSAGDPRPLSGVLPNLSGVGFLSSEGISNYNGLQTSFQRRFTKGLGFDANYTYAKALSDVTGFSEEGQQGWSNADPNNIRGIEYGVAENDIRNRFALSLNYELQYGKNFTGIKKAALSGWESNVIAAWQGGKPFSVVNSGSDPLGLSNVASPLYNGGNDRPNEIRNPRLSHRSNAEYFDTSAFAEQPVGTVGSEQRNSIYGPHFRHVDFSLFKDFAVTERVVMQFRAEAFDISNTPNYFINNNTGTNTTQFGNANFGKVSQVDPNYVPRQIQFALKASF